MIREDSALGCRGEDGPGTAPLVEGLHQGRGQVIGGAITGRAALAGGRGPTAANPQDHGEKQHSFVIHGLKQRSQNIPHSDLNVSSAHLKQMQFSFL